MISAVWNFRKTSGGQTRPERPSRTVALLTRMNASVDGTMILDFTRANRGNEMILFLVASTLNLAPLC